MDSCPFCEIAAGDGEAHLIHEDDRTVAFLDNRPVATGHVLVAPRAHRTSIEDDETVYSAVFETIQMVTGAMTDTLDPDGVSLFYTTGDLIGTVEHAHVHVVPRYEGDAVSLRLDRGTLSAGEGLQVADTLREGL